MNVDPNVNPTTCDRCGISLEHGWSQRYRGDTLSESICFGCDNTEQVKMYEDTGILTSKIVRLAAINEGRRKYDEPFTPRYSLETMERVVASTARIHCEIKSWERAVWFAGLQTTVAAVKFRGFRLDFTGGLVLVYTIAGRTSITIEKVDDDAQVTLITDESSSDPVMDQQGIRATEDQALWLLVASRNAFLSGARFRRDDKAGFGL